MWTKEHTLRQAMCHLWSKRPFPIDAILPYTIVLSSWCMWMTDKSGKHVLQHFPANREWELRCVQTIGYARMTIVWGQKLLHLMNYSRRVFFDLNSLWGGGGRWGRGRRYTCGGRQLKREVKLRGGLVNFPLNNNWMRLFWWLYTCH